MNNWKEIVAAVAAHRILYYYIMSFSFTVGAY
jgi:hypothetical protein